MSYRPSGSVFVMSVVLAGLAAIPAYATNPNVLIIIADDLGYSDVGFNDSVIRTPNLDGLAEQGAILNHFYAHPYCSPTRSAVMTGNSPLRLGVLRPFGKNSKKSLPLDQKTLPQYFRDRNYRTYLVGKWHLGHARRPYLPTARGFEHFYGHVTGGIGFWDKVHGGGYDWQRNGKTVRDGGYATHLIADEATRLLRENTDQPFLMFANFNAPHLPNEAPADTIASYASVEDVRRRMHAAMVTELDLAVGTILRVLREQNRLGDTIVWFMSDNGGLIQRPVPDVSFAMVDREGKPLTEGNPKPRMFIDFVTLNATEGGSDNTPYQRGKGSVWEGGIRVPAFVTWPDRIRAGRRESLVTVEDVLPTILELTGIDADISGILDGTDRSDVLLTNAPKQRGGYVASGNDGEAYVAMPWKLIRPFRGEVMLFNLDADPQEHNDLARQQPEKARELLALLDEFPRGEPVTSVAGEIDPGFIWDPDFFGGHEDRPPWTEIVTD